MNISSILGSRASNAEPTTKGSHTVFKIWAPSVSSLGKQRQKHRSTWGGNTQQPTDFFRKYGLGLIPKMMFWPNCSERAAKSKVTPYFSLGSTQTPLKEVQGWVVPSGGHTSGSCGKLCRNSNSWALRHTHLFPKLPTWFWYTVKFSNLLSTHSSALGCGCQCVSRIHRMSGTKTNSNLCSEPIRQCKPPRQLPQGKSHFLTQMLTAFKLVYRPNTTCQSAVHRSETQRKKKQPLSLEFSSAGLEPTHPCLYLTLRTLTPAWEQTIFYPQSWWSAQAWAKPGLSKKPTRKTLTFWIEMPKQLLAYSRTSVSHNL